MSQRPVRLLGIALLALLVVLTVLVNTVWHPSLGVFVEELSWVAILGVPMGCLFHRRFLIISSLILFGLASMLGCLVPHFVTSRGDQDAIIVFLNGLLPWALVIAFVSSDLARHWDFFRRIHSESIRTPLWLQLAGAGVQLVAWTVYFAMPLDTFLHLGQLSDAGWLVLNACWLILWAGLLAAVTWAIALVVRRTCRRWPDRALMYRRQDYGLWAVLLAGSIVSSLIIAFLALGRWAAGF